MHYAGTLDAICEVLHFLRALLIYNPEVAPGFCHREKMLSHAPGRSRCGA